MGRPLRILLLGTGEAGATVAGIDLFELIGNRAKSVYVIYKLALSYSFILSWMVFSRD